MASLSERIAKTTKEYNDAKKNTVDAMIKLADAQRIANGAQNREDDLLQKINQLKEQKKIDEARKKTEDKLQKLNMTYAHDGVDSSSGEDMDKNFQVHLEKIIKDPLWTNGQNIKMTKDSKSLINKLVNDILSRFTRTAQMLMADSNEKNLLGRHVQAVIHKILLSFASLSDQHFDRCVGLAMDRPPSISNAKWKEMRTSRLLSMVQLGDTLEQISAWDAKRQAKTLLAFPVVQIHRYMLKAGFSRVRQ